MPTRETIRIPGGRMGPAGVGVTSAEKASFAPKASPTFTGTVSTEGDTNLGNGSTDTTTLTGQFRTAGSAPSIAPGGSAGSGATASIVRGDDTNGVLQVNTGTSAGTGSLATVTFNQVRSNANYIVQLTAKDSDAAHIAVYVPDSEQAAGSFKVYSDTDTPDSTSFQWGYLVVGRSS